MNPGWTSRRGILVVLLVAIIATGCAEKAKVIQVGAEQFGVESLAAIEKIDQFRRKETETTPKPPEQVSRDFVNAVKGSTGSITPRRLRILAEPLKLNIESSEAQWQAFLQKMREQYTTFVSMFRSLDKGSFFARSAVKETVPLLDKLTAQMAAFAASLQKAPAEFLRERVVIADELELVRDAKPFTELTDVRLRDLERRLRDLGAAEAEITRSTIEQTVKAARLGSDLRKLLVDYDKLSLNDIAEGLSIAFGVAGAIPGLDVSALKAETDALTKTINEDPALKGFAEAALGELGPGPAALSVEEPPRERAARRMVDA